MIDQETAKNRSQIIQKIRNFFTNQNFLEVETPILNKIPGMEPYLTPFETKFTDDTPLFLNTSPELQMKKLLAQGYGNIFNITKVFRNGETGGPTHNPEFTMIEWYRTDANYQDLMQDCEELINSLKPYPKFKKISIYELFLTHCKIDLLENRGYQTFKNTADSKGFDTNACQNWDDIFFKLFLNHIEKDLGKDAPTIVYDYPGTQAALAKKSETEPFFAERFELYIDGIELANAFSELTNSAEQRQRLQEEQQERKKLAKTVFPIDEEFLASLESISQPCAGIALGIDRLIMVILGKKSINDVILFPYGNNN